MKWTDVYVNWAEFEEVRVEAVLYYKGERFKIEDVKAYEDSEGDFVVPLDEKVRVQAELKRMYAVRTGVAVEEVVEATH